MASANASDAGVVGLLTGFFESGGLGFQTLWRAIEQPIDRMARQLLRKRLVRGRFTVDDENAVQEVMQQVALGLLEVPSKDRKTWFDPSRGSSDSAVLGWIYGFVRHAVADYCDDFHDAREGRKVVVESGLSFNELSERDSILKTAVAKVEVNRTELCEVMNDCIERLPSDDMRTLVRLWMNEDISRRALAERLGMHVSKVQRRLTQAFDLLRPMLETKGYDASALAA